MAPQITLLPGPGDIFSDITSGLGEFTSKIGGVFDPSSPTSISSSLPTDLSSSSSLSLSSVPTPSASLSDSLTSLSTTPTPSSTVPVIPSTVTNILTSTAELPTHTLNSDSPSRSSGFLQNKALSGFVFALVGLIGLAVILSAVMFVVRRRRRKSLLQEAVSFEPASSRMYLDEMDRDNHQWNEKMGGGYSDGGHSYGGHIQYPLPPPPPAMHYEATPPSQLAYGVPANYGAAAYMGQDIYDGFTSTTDHSRTSESSQASLGQRRVPPPALPDSFGDDGNRSATPEAIGPPVPLKIANQ